MKSKRLDFLAYASTVLCAIGVSILFDSLARSAFLVWKLGDHFVLEVDSMKFAMESVSFALAIVTDLACSRSDSVGIGNISAFAGLALFVAMVASVIGVIHVD
jgi:hypothetical protein